jgi:hypothetical protein
MQHYFMTTMHRFIAVGLLLLYFHLVPQAQNDSLRAFEPELFVELPNVRDMAISPDGKEMFFTVESYKKEFSAVFTCLKKGKKWSEAASLRFQWRISRLGTGIFSRMACVCFLYPQDRFRNLARRPRTMIFGIWNANQLPKLGPLPSTLDQL